MSPAPSLGGRKSSRTVAQWRGTFQRVYLPDQCYPGAVMAALVSADYVLGTKCTAILKMGDINRHLNYRHGRATPIGAPMQPLFTRLIGGHGLEVNRSTDASGSFEQLKALVSSDACSFPVVGVDLELVKDYDARVEIRRIPTADLPPPQSDHAVVVLIANDEEVEFFDPTRRDIKGSLVEERVPTPTFLARWSGDPIVANDRVWFTRTKPAARQKRRRPRPTLKDFAVKEGSGQP